MKSKALLLFFILSHSKNFFKDECEAYGQVKKIVLDPESEGNIWIKFENVQSAINTQKSLHDRYFCGKKVCASFVHEPVFKKKFGI